MIPLAQYRDWRRNVCRVRRGQLGHRYDIGSVHGHQHLLPVRPIDDVVHGFDRASSSATVGLLKTKETANACVAGKQLFSDVIFFHGILWEYSDNEVRRGQIFRVHQVFRTPPVQHIDRLTDGRLPKTCLGGACGGPNMRSSDHVIEA